jgi:plastocyanin
MKTHLSLFADTSRAPRRLVVALLLAPLFEIAGAAEIPVGLQHNMFIPNDIEIQVGDTIRFENRGGFHDVRADDGSFGNNASETRWRFRHTFNQVGEFLVHCSVHSAPGRPIATSMNARIKVVAAVEPSFAINQGIAGAWYNEATPGQGILFDVRPDDSFIFGAIFTYETGTTGKLGAPEHRWLTVQGNYTGDTAQVPIFLTSGGVFNDPATTTTAPVGTATIRFDSCASASMGYQLDDSQLQGTIPLTRVIPGTESLCETLSEANRQAQ